MSHEFWWVAVAVLTVTSTARITRLLTFDDFPPVKVVRDAFGRWTDKTDRRRGWQLLAYCGYCMSFWVALLVIGTGWTSDWHEVWWLVNSAFGGSYLAAILMAHDGDED